MLVLALVVAAPASAAKPKVKACKNESLVPTSEKQMAKIQNAVLCLVNRERTKRGLAKAKDRKTLHRAAKWQAKDMLKFAYFDHERPKGGPEFVERVLRFGYADDASSYSLGENLAWASSAIASPKRIVRLWMESPGHRKNILTRNFRDQSISAVWSDGDVGGDYSDSNGPFVVFVNQFGRTWK